MLDGTLFFFFFFLKLIRARPKMIGSRDWHVVVVFLIHN
jgi:hypothetical protein